MPRSYKHLPPIDSREGFWDLPRGSYDIGNLHLYEDWGRFRSNTTAEQDERTVRGFRAQMQSHAERDNPPGITEIGWWGTASFSNFAKEAESDPDLRGAFKPFFTGREYPDHPVIAREDALRAAWMQDMFLRLVAIPGCEKVFLWVSMDEFEGGSEPDALYGTASEGQNVKQVDLRHVIAGDRQWHKTAYALQELLK